MMSPGKEFAANLVGNAGILQKPSRALPGFPACFTRQHASSVASIGAWYARGFPRIAPPALFTMSSRAGTHRVQGLLECRSDSGKKDSSRASMARFKANERRCAIHPVELRAQLVDASLHGRRGRATPVPPRPFRNSPTAKSHPGCARRWIAPQPKTSRITSRPTLCARSIIRTRGNDAGTAEKTLLHRHK